MKYTNPAAVAAIPDGCVLSLRTQRNNPNHHLWWNNGTWWCHFTVHRPDHTKQRLRVPLGTKNVHLGRSRRDAILAEMVGGREEMSEKPMREDEAARG